MSEIAVKWDPMMDEVPEKEFLVNVAKQQIDNFNETIKLLQKLHNIKVDISLDFGPALDHGGWTRFITMKLFEPL